MRSLKQICLTVLVLIISSTVTFSQSKIELTEEEKAWIAAHPMITLGFISSMEPVFMTGSDNSQTGILPDILMELEKSTGLHFQIETATWPEVIEKARVKEWDGILANAPLLADSIGLLRTKGFLKAIPALFARSNPTFTIKGLKDLYGKKLCLIKSAIVSNNLVAEHKGKIEVIEVNSIAEGMKLVIEGEADAFLGLNLDNYYLIRHMIIGIEMVNMNIDIDFDGVMSIRNDWPELISILDKGLDQLGEENINSIISKWVDPEHEHSRVHNWLIIGPLVISVLFISMGILLLFRILDRSRKKPLSFQFALPTTRRIIALLTSLIVLIAFSLALWALTDIEARVKSDIRQSLQTVLRTTQQAMMMWAKDKRYGINQIASDPRIVELTLRQLEHHDQGLDLLTSSELSELRILFEEFRNRSGNQGFFLIAPDGISIASMRDENIDQTNLIQKHRPDLLKRAFKGEVVLIPPIPSDVVIETQANISGVNFPPTMFFAGPLRDSSGKVIAVLTERFNPHGEFTKINLLGRIGNSGETYTFDRNGILLSESRFIKELVSAGLILPGEQSILSIEIRDPGGNLVEGFEAIQPTDQQPLTHMAANAIKGISDYNVEGYRDYRGVPVFGAWTWDELLGIGLTTEIDEAEAMETYANARLAILTILGITVLTSIVFTLLILTLGSRANRSLLLAHDRLEVRVADRTEKLSLARDEAENALANLKSVQLQLIQSEKMASLGVLTAGISHEINNPVSIVQTSSFALDNDIKDLKKLNDKYREYIISGRQDISEITDFEKSLDYDLLLKAIKQEITDIQEGTKRTALIVKGLGDFSYKDGLEMEPVDIHAGLDSTLNLLYSRLKNSVTLIKNYDQSLSKVTCHIGQINQVFMNLLTNALDAIGDKGQIEITTKDQGKNVMISVKDDGPGVAEEIKNKIFDPFSTTKKIGAGTGLGLSISYGIIKKHGGSIEVKSEVGKGSEFIVTLPLSDRKT